MSKAALPAEYVKLVAVLTRHGVDAGVRWLAAQPKERGLVSFLENCRRLRVTPEGAERLLMHFVEHRLLFSVPTGPIQILELAGTIDQATGLALAAQAGEEAAARVVEDGVAGGQFLMSLIEKWGAEAGS